MAVVWAGVRFRALVLWPMYRRLKLRLYLQTSSERHKQKLGTA
jgi:hypothetical protein